MQEKYIEKCKGRYVEKVSCTHENSGSNSSEFISPPLEQPEEEQTWWHCSLQPFFIHSQKATGSAFLAGGALMKCFIIFMSKPFLLSPCLPLPCSTMGPLCSSLTLSSFPKPMLPATVSPGCRHAPPFLGEQGASSTSTISNWLKVPQEMGQELSLFNLYNQYKWL